MRLSVFIVVLMSAFFIAGEVHAQVAGSSGYRLVGIVQGKDFVAAVIDDGKNEQSVYRLREQLPDGSVVAKVQKDSVTIKRSDGSSYDLFLLQNAKSSPQTKSSAGAATGSTAVPAPQNSAPAPVPNAVPPTQKPSFPGIGNQEPGTDNASKKKGRGRRDRFGSPRTPGQN